MYFFLFLLSTSHTHGPLAGPALEAVPLSSTKITDRETGPAFVSTSVRGRLTGPRNTSLVPHDRSRYSAVVLRCCVCPFLGVVRVFLYFFSC